VANPWVHSTAQLNDETGWLAPAEAPGVDADPRPSAVLLVARDRSLDESCRRTLSDAGVQCVVSVPSSSRAIELLGESKLFDAVVIGVGAGDVEAVKLAQHMRRYRSDTPTVVVSPIRNLQIPGAVTQGTARGEQAQGDKTDIFRKIIRKVVRHRQSTRVRPAR
jgi:DNA-binding NtrC family response regulator